MSESLQINTISKKESYETLLPQIHSLIAGEGNLIANLANICSAIQMTFDHLWTGFYLVEKNQLVLGPFQGPIACTRIPMGKGVCGTAWNNQQTVIVKNVNEFEGHIACSSDSVSEIVVPLFDLKNQIIGVLDIDSIHEGMFDKIDQQYLEELCGMITKNLDC